MERLSARRRTSTRTRRGLVAELQIAKTLLGDETLALADDRCLDASVGFGVHPDGERGMPPAAAAGQPRRARPHRPGCSPATGRRHLGRQEHTMTDTTTRPLPVDRQALKAYMPARARVSVTPARAAIGRIDQAIAACREQITQRDELDHQLVSDLIGAAIAGDKLEPIAARMVPGDRPALDWRLEQLQQARLLAGHRLTQPSAPTRSTSHGSRRAPRSSVSGSCARAPTPRRTDSRPSSRSPPDTDPPVAPGKPGVRDQGAGAP